MTAVARARGLTKHYGRVRALDEVAFDIEPGRIVGLIGPNGAGKTTALKALLGLTPFHGSLEVLGRDPRRQRHRLMQEVCFIADVAVLPRWLRAHRAVELMDGIHPRFSRERAMELLARSDVQLERKIGQLSKGMVAQLHLALVMAIDAKLLVLDEPTLGLDILYRKAFYTSLLNDYFDAERTILVTTHQVEEIEQILTDLMFIKDGKLVLDTPMDKIGERFVEVLVPPERLDEARALRPLHERELFGKTVLLFEDVERARLAELGELHTPGVADLFVAKMQRRPT